MEIYKLHYFMMYNKLPKSHLIKTFQWILKLYLFIKNVLRVEFFLAGTFI